MRLNKKQVEKLGKFLLDISKLIFGSMVLGLFSTEFGPVVVIVFGLVM